MPDELIPAAHGVALRDALHRILEYRGVDINDVNIFLDASSTPLSLQFETYRLGGHHLIVRAKDSAEGGHITRTNSTGSCGSGRTAVSNSSGKDDKRERKISGSQRGRRSAIMISTDDLTSDTLSSPSGLQDGSWKSNKVRQLPQRRGGIFFNPFRTDKEKMEILTELLNQYSQHGIPELHGLLTFCTPAERQDDLYQLENHWDHIVNNAHELSKRKQNQQDTIWELLSTEVFYIRRLKVITDLFRAVLCNLQNECILNEIDIEKVFGNISEVYEANHHFWVDYLLPMLKEARASRKPLNPIIMKEGFLKFEEIFQPYIKYCLEQNMCVQYVKERNKDSELFKTYVAWCETQKDCERLKLVDLLAKPMQRLTKYSLLLKAIHKKTDNEDHKSSILEMNECVENFVCGVDATLRQRHEQERLASIISRIESYRLTIDSNNDELEKIIKDYCFLDLTCPMPGCGNQQSRQLLLEGTGFKLRDPPSSKQVDVQCFLFTDMLLICKAAGKKGDKVRVIRQPYIVDRLVLQELKDGSGLLVVYLNEYKVVTTAFILYTCESKQWLDNIRRAQELYKEAKSAAASERSELGFLRVIAEEEDYDFPSIALLSARSPRSSSRSSLVHSHSGSIDMNDTSNNPQATSPSVPTVPSRLSSDLVQLTSNSLQRVSSSSVKPPLLKSKNVSSLVATSQASNEGPTNENDRLYAKSIEFPYKTCVAEMDDDGNRKLANKRMCRAERRYHTADSIENMKKEKDNSIHKRLSWNYGQHSTGGTCSSCDKSRNKHPSQCLSMESVHSSSGVSSTASLHLSAGSVECDASFEGSDILEEDPLQDDNISQIKMVNGGGHSHSPSSEEMSEQIIVGPPGSNIKIDISEVREGISSVQITENGGCISHNKPSKVDLRRMKEFLLTNCTVEASEV